MRHFDLCVSITGGMAAALVSMDANASGTYVDATLVDYHGNRDVRMPTDFDEFTPAAMWPYMGSSFEIGGHVRLLNYAMHKAGFWGLRTEWWHFTIADWQKYLPPEKAKSAAQVLGTHWEGGL